VTDRAGGRRPQACLSRGASVTDAHSARRPGRPRVRPPGRHL